MQIPFKKYKKKGIIYLKKLIFKAENNVIVFKYIVFCHNKYCDITGFAFFCYNNVLYRDNLFIFSIPLRFLLLCSNF